MSHPSTEPDVLLDRARQGDDTAFAELVAPSQPSLFRHCYRMLGSGPDAEEAVQDTIVRAWRRLDTFDAAGTFGGWLYQIATDVCLDALRSRKARLEPAGTGPPSAPGTDPGWPEVERSWVEPVGDLHAGDDPADEVTAREDISLAFVAALQRLAPRQRACLLLHDVLGFSQAEVAEALGITPSAVNSLLFRARQSVRPRSDAPLVLAHDPRLHDLLERYVRAWRLADIGALLEIVADDIRLSMPPMTEWFSGRDTVLGFIDDVIFAATKRHGVTLIAGWCNGQPAFASYEPDLDGTLLVSGLQLLEVREIEGQPRVTDITSYRDADLAVRCGLPRPLPVRLGGGGRQWVGVVVRVNILPPGSRSAGSVAGWKPPMLPLPAVLLGTEGTRRSDRGRPGRQGRTLRAAS